MFQRDYILRMVEQMTQFVAEISGLRKQHKQEQAFEMIDELLGRFFRLNSRLLLTLSEKDIIAMLSVNGFMESGKLLSLSHILKEEALLYNSLNKPEDAYPRSVKSLQLAHACSEEEDSDLAACIHQVEELTQLLKRYRLPIGLSMRLYAFYYKAGLYNKSEDELFDLLDWTVGKPEHDEVGAQLDRFYKELLIKSDDELVSGGLPHREVEEGYTEMKRFFL